MQLTQYSTLCIDAHGVLINRDSAIYRGLFPVLSRLEDPPSKARVMDEYILALHALTDEQMSTVSAHCIVYRDLISRWGLEPDWQAGIEFASGLGVGALYEDAPGAIHYLRKFYRLQVVTTLDEQEFSSFDQRIGLSDEERVTAGSFVAARAIIRQMANDRRVLLLSGGPPPDEVCADHCRITRNSDYQPATDECAFVSLTDFIRMHQLALRHEFP